MRKIVSIFEISLLMLASLAFSYILSSSNTELQPIAEGNGISLLRKAILSWLGSNLVSAESAVWTCPVNNNGATCQEYLSATCDENCNVSCFPGPKSTFSECSIGTCIDAAEGTCTSSPKSTCTSQGGIWKSNSLNEIPECKPGCCLVGGQASFITQKACNTLSSRLGLPTNFRQVNNELACIVLANPGAEGACVLENDEEISCKFTTKESCLSQLKGEFHEKMLCSNPALETSCTRQAKTSCFDDKDELYWVDSCGNRENIFDSDKTRSWNNGLVLPKDQSCQVNNGNSLLANQATCGNCNYLAGNVCGKPGSKDKKIGGSDFVCKSLSCTDENGAQHKNGESWCAFDSMTGVDGSGNEARGTDLPGSSHYKKICLNGEIRTETCQEGRKEVCVESRDSTIDFSTAACRINQWRVCVDANGDPEKMIQCKAGEFSDCYTKQVTIDSKFNFELCVPKYPPGADLGSAEGGEAAQTLCSLASQKCTYSKTKGIFKSKKVNQNCQTAIFTETLNNLCVSLGDCGVKPNFAGQLSEDGYSVSGAPRLDNDYLDKFKKYAAYPALFLVLHDPIAAGFFVPASAVVLSEKELAQAFGVEPDKLPDVLAGVGAGTLGVAVASLAIKGVPIVGVLSQGTTVATSTATAATSTQITTSTGTVYATNAGSAQVASSAFANVAVGAAIGAITGYAVAKVFGLKGEAQTHLVLAGAVSGGVSGYFLGSAAASTGVTVGGVGGTAGTLGSFAAAALAVFIWAIVVVVVLAVIFLALGIGKTKKTSIEFQCLPWQPPVGGDKCSECGKNGLPCNEYKCHSLGQACQFIEENEGTNDALCIAVQRNDVSAPQIKPNLDAATGGLSYETISQGFKVKANSSSGCLPAYSTVQLGISLNEPAQCKISGQHTARFSDMEDFFTSNLFRANHTAIFPIPSLELISASTNTNLGENKDVNLYLRCQDINGNANTEEYTINFCLSPEPDRTAPVISRFDNPSPAFSAFEATQKNIVFFTNEPAQCKWSLSDQDYDSMSNEADCLNDVDDITLYGWQCNATLPIAAQQNSYFFRCKDQPWLEGGEASNRNKNSQSSLYEVRRSQDPLKIVSLAPNNITLLRSGLPTEINLSVITNGGAPETNRFCEFQWGGKYIRFLDSGTDTHVQPRLNLFENKTYNIPIRCTDDVGNRAFTAATFNLKIDNEGPKISRVYTQNNRINVITNEPALCFSSTESCSEAALNGTSLSGNNLFHSYDFKQKISRFVVCKDAYTNQGACLEVRGGEY